MRRRRARAVAAMALAAIAAPAAGCEAIVGSDVPAFTCSGTTGTTCPLGQYCKGAGCTACESRDVCDGFDNDCNGKIDDGPFADRDGDGWPVCGRFDEAAGRLVQPDCDDDDPDVHPGAREVCDGKDDDCDGTADEPQVVCPAGETCVPASKACVPQAQTCASTSCPPMQTCDPGTQKCVSTGSLGLGDACTASSACASHVCGDQSILGTDFVGKNGAVCTEPCCASAGCPEGFVCFAPGTAGRYCVREAAIGRPNSGNGAPGAACGGGADCRSGLCGAGGTCLDTCCGDADCTNGTACTLDHQTGHAVFQCAAPPMPGNGRQNDGCSTDADCRGGICFNYGNSTFPDRHCIAGCCGSSACGSVDFGFPLGRWDATCIEADGQQVSSFGGDANAVCAVQFNSTGGGGVGDSCSSGSDCRSAQCVNKRCTDVCCTDADCRATQPDWVCRPAATGGGSHLRCKPGP